MPSSITLTVSHLPTSTSFFLSALQPLDYVFRGRQDQTIGFGPAYPLNVPADFWITQEIPGVPAGAAHVAFPASSRAQVQDFFLAAIKAGGKIHGEPCQRDANGYYSAAVIDFDGNSIEAVYRPGFDEGNKENVDGRSMFSQRSASVKSPSAVAPPKRVETSKAPTAVSRARSNAPSQVRSVTAPSQLSSPTPEKMQPKPKPQGDVLEALINEARSAANVARDLVNSVRPNASSSPPNTSPGNSSGGAGGGGAGEAIVGTLLGVAAGAALHYAFSNRSKESQDHDHGKDENNSQPHRPSVVGRSVTEPPMIRPEYSSAGSAYYDIGAGRGYRTIEPPPSTYSRNHEGQRLITMHDNDPQEPSKSDYASTVRPSARRMSIDSGFGPGPRDVERDRDTGSHASSKASRHSKRSAKLTDAPPTSYRAPTALTEAEKSKAGSRSGSRARSRSSSLGRITGHDRGQAQEEPTRSRSQSRASSRRSRRDAFDDGEAQTVFHVTETLPETKGHSVQGHTTGRHSNAASKAATRISSKHSSTHTVKETGDPADYPLPPSRAATWAGSENGSFVSARSKFGPSPARGIDIPRTIIGKLNPLRQAGGGGRSGGAGSIDTASVVSKQKELQNLDVTDREVRPEDSVSQISVDSRRSKRSSRASRG